MKPERVAAIRRRMTWVAAAIAAGALVYFFSTYGSWTVIPGMDTMEPDIPPGATCIIEKNPGTLVAGRSVIVLELPGGAALLTRVDRIDDAGIHIRHDNRESAFLSYEQNTYQRKDVRALVLTTLAPDKETGGR